MANPVRGEVAFDHDGRTYKMSFSMNALCELEDKLGKGVMEILPLLSQGEKIRMSLVRAVFWAGLLDHQPDTTIEEAGSLMSSVGFAGAFDQINQAMSITFPEQPAGPLDDRRKPKSGTSKRS